MTIQYIIGYKPLIIVKNMNVIMDELDQCERIFVKYTTLKNRGVEPITLSRNAIGYVIHGEKCIHNGDTIHVISQGDIFILPQGTHYIEDIPAIDEPFEQIVFYYTASQMQQIIAKMDIVTTAFESCDDVKSMRGCVSATPSRIVRNFLQATIRHYDYGGFNHNCDSEKIRLMEFAYLILSHENSSIRHAFLTSLDSARANFERVIYNNLFKDRSIQELALECSRSLTAFKKEFKQIFGMPPHQWYMYQRLHYAKLLLVTTRKSISQVGNESIFPNTSHFIKLFKRCFGMTPAHYRATNSELEAISNSEVIHEELVVG